MNNDDLTTNTIGLKSDMALLRHSHSSRRRPRRSSPVSSSVTSLSAFCTLLLALLSSIQATAQPQSDDALTPESVVLVTGAAGFLGSELAMALGRVYDVKKIICVDVMSAATTTHTNSLPEEQNLALFEFQRQRAFHVLQDLQQKIHFYRSDIAPSLPEYFDLGEVPVLEYIWREHSDITHVVHLAEPPGSQYMAVPRTKESIKAGLMETVLEQALKQPRPPHIVYASSYEVYDHRNSADGRGNAETTAPFRESTPITVPSSLRGASKLLDEMLAQTYYETDQLFTVGLRLFSLYGPWGVPGSPLFEMAERAVAGDVSILQQNGSGESDLWDDVRDYLYIDDAVDAVLSAMQVRTVDGAPLVINVGSGQGTSLREIARHMETLLPRKTPDLQVPSDSSSTTSTSRTVSFASMDRAENVLGFQPQISLQQGLTKLLAWHYDRAFPYGSHTAAENQHHEALAKQGIVSCLPYDKECLNGTPVFPCASECSHEAQCTSSFYDDVLVVTRSLATECRDILYTVALEIDLENIPSANMAGSSRKASFLEGPCNIAFVSESSPLVQRLKEEQDFSSSWTVVEEFLRIASNSNGKEKKLLTHGYWTLIPVWTPSFVTGDEALFRLLPKLSPGLFFGKSTHRAIYCDPNVVFKNVKSIIREAHMQPYLDGVEGATAMLVGGERPGPTTAFGNAAGHIGQLPLSTESVQNAAYRMIQIGAIDEMIAGEGSSQHALVDSSWVVHTLQSEDSRLFRCDVLGEVVQWDVPTDKTAFEFIMELHDMWSRVIVNTKENEPWWIGDAVLTVPQETSAASDESDKEADMAQDRRRLADTVAGAEAETEGFSGEGEGVGKEDDADGEGDADEEEESNEEEDADTDEDADKEESDEEDESKEAENEEDETTKETDNSEETDKTSEANRESKAGGAMNAEALLRDDKEITGDETEGTSTDVDAGEKDEAFDSKKQAGDETEEENEGFLGEKNEEVDTGAGDAKPNDETQDQEETEPENEALAQEELNEVDTGDEDEKSEQKNQESQDVERDVSGYDTWMGVLSSTSTYYFVRIVPSLEVGAMYLEDYSID